MKKFFPVIFLLLFGVAFIFYFYGDILFHPNNYLFNDTGDALKNYFTYAFPSHHNSPQFNFGGMNYPYGESIFYTDCHPVLALILKSISTPGNLIDTHSIGILNAFLIASVFLTFFASYFLLRAFHLPGWLCVLFSISITLMAPQLFRLSGHLALSYSLAIPVSWLLLLVTFRTKKMLAGCFLFFNMLFWLFIHAYLGVIVGLFLVLVTLFHFFADPGRRKNFVHYGLVTVCLLLPAGIFYLTVHLTDSHVGRTDNPTGFFLYNAEPDDIFIPHHPPLKPLLDKISGGVIKQEWEAWSYIGFSATIIILIVLLFSLSELFRKTKSNVFTAFFNSREMNAALLASLVLLLFAMAFPFRQLPGLLDHIPVIKQFRATGRFTWPFYFVSMVFVARVLWMLFRNADTERRRLQWILIMVGVSMFNLVEGIPYHLDISETLRKSPNLFDRKQLTGEYSEAIASIEPGKYQALLPLPFYYQGSESFSRPRNDETVKASIVMSYHTGLPLFSANLTRTSIAESKKIVQLVSPGFYYKEIINDLDDPRPFIVIRTRDSLTRNEQNLFSRCKLLFAGKNLSVFSLQRTALFTDERSGIVNEYLDGKNLLYTQDSMSFTRDSAFYYLDNFDGLKSEKTYRGNGGFQGFKKGKNIFAEFSPNTLRSGKIYTVRLWLYNNTKDALNDWFRLIVEEYNEKQNTWMSTTFFPEQCETINGDWSMAEFNFTVEDPSNKISLVSIGKDYEKQPLYADELLIMEADVNVYRFYTGSGLMFFNNHTFTIPEGTGFISTP